MLTAAVLRKDTFDMSTDRWTYVFTKERAYISLARTLLLTHARAVNVYRKEFKESQKGQIGITLVSNNHAEEEADKRILNGSSHLISLQKRSMRLSDHWT